jgi:hypothetical protein
MQLPQHEKGSGSFIVMPMPAGFPRDAEGLQFRKV